MANVGKLNFDNGLKRYIINEDENVYIEFNPSDVSILTRLKEIMEKIEKKNIEFDSGEISPEKMEKEVRGYIDYMLNAPVSEKIFGKASCLSPCLNGKMLFMNFLDALAPALRKDISVAVKKTGQNIEKYTSNIVEE